MFLLPLSNEKIVVRLGKVTQAKKKTKENFHQRGHDGMIRNWGCKKREGETKHR